MRDDLNVIHQRTDSGMEKQVVSEAPQTPSSREPTAIAAQPADDAALLPTYTDSPARPAETDFSRSSVLPPVPIHEATRLYRRKLSLP
ncbi:hypothetical protein M407DRAFT_26936 [Tulasnella calospora MUT 4182]|uniref:Uncharacterized protein n=1 Tax=Tulasnella calospora MUT 4182 TaxID=1051891 RepID=A0A0C3QDG3_9AGAM|nr:hypothetical protein M407DRAFT_26936 [Tulasnella calospora MUT 4182]